MINMFSICRQVEVSLLQLERYETPLDFKALEEVRRRTSVINVLPLQQVVGVSRSWPSQLMFLLRLIVYFMLAQIRDELIEQGYMKPLAAGSSPLLMSSNPLPVCELCQVMPVFYHLSIHSVEPAKGRQQKKKKQSLLETVVSGMRQYVSPSGASRNCLQKRKECPVALG